MRLAYQLADLPVEDTLGQLRSDRVLHCPVPPRQPGTNGLATPPRPGELTLADPATWPDPAVATTTETTRYGTAAAHAWDRLHPRLTHRSAWISHDGPLPVIEGTLIRLQVDHLPGDRHPKPVWLWCSAASVPPAEVDRCWRRSCAGSTWNTPSACSSRSSAGPPRKSAPRPLRTAGPGSSSSVTPSCGSPGRSPPTCACPGNGPPRQAGSPPPGSAAGSGTSTPPCPASPARRNPANRAPAARQGRGTAARHPATTWARRRKGMPRSRHGANVQVKRQAERRNRMLGCTGVSASRSPRRDTPGWPGEVCASTVLVR